MENFREGHVRIMRFCKRYCIIFESIFDPLFARDGEAGAQYIARKLIIFR